MVDHNSSKKVQKSTKLKIAKLEFFS